jgi:hypothetical protein
VDLYSGTACQITTGPAAGPTTAAVQTIDDVIQEHWDHPEAKSLGPDGQPCTGRTRGLLRRRPVLASYIEVTGKESNRLSEVEDRTVATWAEVQNLYHRSGVGAWESDVAPLIKALKTEAAIQLVSRQTGISPRTLWRIKAGRASGMATRQRLLRWAEALWRHPQPLGHCKTKRG